MIMMIWSVIVMTFFVGIAIALIFIVGFEMGMAYMELNEEDLYDKNNEHYRLARIGAWIVNNVM